MWKTVENLEKLLVALLAAQKAKLSIHEMASYYGEDISYDTIEHRLRGYYKEAQEVRRAIGDVPNTPTSRKRKAETTGGRVEKKSKTGRRKTTSKKEDGSTEDRKESGEASEIENIRSKPD